MMLAVSWLHFTDLHFGEKQHSRLWPNVHDELVAELGRLHGVTGPWDLIVFTGDLTNRGLPEEFDKVDRWLAKLMACIDELQQARPAVLAVPGNHDLQRPADPNHPIVKGLRKWHSDDSVRSDFFGHNRYCYRSPVENAFASYGDWWRKTCRDQITRLNLQPGSVPGDFSATINKQGLSLGIIGLNSAYLHLAHDVQPQQLALDVKQLLAVCDNEPGDWARRRHASLLLTHHPPDWLPKLGASSQAEYKREIYKEHRFVAHLYGHMHEADSSIMGVVGEEPRRSIQGRALFAVEPYASESRMREREHGFGIFRLEVKQPGDQAVLRIWPRRLQEEPTVQFVADTRMGRMIHDREIAFPIRLLRNWEPPPANAPPPAEGASEPPQTASSQPGVPPGQRQQPKGDALRRYVDAVVGTDSVFDRLCIDYFRDVHQKFGSGQNHVDKLNLLILCKSPGEIIAALERAFPVDAKRHAHLLRSQTAE